MPAQETTYVVELVCGYPEWWRFNLYMMVVSCDSNGKSLSFKNYTDRIYEVEYGVRRDPLANFDATTRRACIESEPCHHIEVYVYAVTNTFPDSESVRDSPPFEATLNVSAGGKQIHSRNYQVNQWGGLTIAGQQFGVHS